METRTFVLPTILMCWLSLPLLAEAAPGDNSAPPAAATVKPAAPPTATPAKPTAPPTPAPPKASAPSAKLPAPKNPVSAALQQVVMLERAGRPIGIGTLLSGDGRILTALSPLTHGNQIDAHYPEGQIVRVKLSHSDRAWDLALLTPEGVLHRAGLKASHDPTPAAGSKLHAVGYVRDKQLGASDLTIKAKSVLRGGDSAELPDALELPFAVKPIDVGGPLLNDQGEVVAVVARACSVGDKMGCTLAPYGAPVSAIRSFLRSVPTRRKPWTGLDAVAFDAGVARGVRVANVVPRSPAANAGLRAGPPGSGDVVLAVNGTPVATAEDFSDAVSSHATGSGMPLRLTVLSEGHYREVAMTLDDSSGPGASPGPARERIFQSDPPRPWPRASGPRPEPVTR